MLHSLLDANESPVQLRGYVRAAALQQQGSVGNGLIWSISHTPSFSWTLKTHLGAEEAGRAAEAQGLKWVCVCVRVRGYEDLIAVSMATCWHSAVSGSLLMACQRSESTTARAADNQRPQEGKVKWFHGLQVWQVGWLQTSRRPPGTCFLKTAATSGLIGGKGTARLLVQGKKGTALN